jgi:malate synthase
VAQPGVAGTPDPSEPGLARAGEGDPAAGATGGGIPAAALAEQQWPAIQAMFVDDPKGSVQRAAAATDEVVKAFVASLEREQAALRATWEHDTTTEDLRTALQQYRAFCGRLEGLA